MASPTSNVSAGGVGSVLPEFAVALSKNFGYVHTKQAAETLKEYHELENTLRYVSLKTSVDFGTTPVDKCKHRVLWEEAQQSLGGKIEFDGVPFIHLNKNVYECEYSKDHKFKSKLKAKEARAMKRKQKASTGHAQKARNLIQDTKKKDCGAKLVMKEVMKFPEYEIERNSNGERRRAVKLTQDALAAGEARGERRIYVYLPEGKEHDGHPVGKVCGAWQRVDHRIIEYIQQMVGAGVSSMAEMRLHVERFVSGTLFSKKALPDMSNRRYFPEDSDIRYHMYAAEGKKKWARSNTYGLPAAIEKWQKENPAQLFFYRKGSKKMHKTDGHMVLNKKPPQSGHMLQPQSAADFMCSQLQPRVPPQTIQQHLQHVAGNMQQQQFPPQEQVHHEAQHETLDQACGSQEQRYLCAKQQSQTLSQAAEAVPHVLPPYPISQLQQHLQQEGYHNNQTINISPPPLPPPPSSQPPPPPPHMQQQLYLQQPQSFLPQMVQQAMPGLIEQLQQHQSNVPVLQSHPLPQPPFPATSVQQPLQQQCQVPQLQSKPPHVQPTTQLHQHSTQLPQPATDQQCSATLKQQPFKEVTPPGDTTLLVHQTVWQQYLLARYGNELCILDPVYRTTGLKEPLYFVIVKTNCDYQVVATFVVEEARQALIYEALSKIKEWNPSWLPANFLTDVVAEDVNGVQQTFPGYSVYFCDYHRQHAWDQLLGSESADLRSGKTSVQAMLDRIANAGTREEYATAVAHLKDSQAWLENSRLRDWLSNFWLPLHQRWVRAFRQQSFVKAVNTTLGVGLQNKLFSQCCLKADRLPKLAILIRDILFSFLPRNKSAYFQCNSKADDGCRSYSASIPGFLRRRPRSFLRTCLQHWREARNIPPDRVKLLDPSCGIFLVQSPGATATSSDPLTVNMMRPDCSCRIWERTALPCKHILAVIAHVEAWPWERLPTSYTDSPYFNIDYDFVQKVSAEEPQVCSLMSGEGRDVEQSTDLGDESDLAAKVLEMESENLKGVAVTKEDVAVLDSGLLKETHLSNENIADNSSDSRLPSHDGAISDDSESVSSRCFAVLRRLEATVGSMKNTKSLEKVLTVLEKSETAVNRAIKRDLRSKREASSPRAKRRRKNRTDL